MNYNYYQKETEPNKFPLITLILMLINIIFFVLLAVDKEEVWNFTAGDLLDWGGNFSGLTLGKDWWRLFTSMFMHGNLLHLLLNMYSLFSIGSAVERLVGRSQFFVYYLLVGIGSGLASLLFNTFIVSVGASGAIFGLLGFYCVHAFTTRGKSATSATGTSIAITIAINISIGLTVSFIDNVAHIGGLVIGILCGLIIIFFQYISSYSTKNNLRAFVFITIACSTVFCFTYTAMSRDRVAYFNFFTDFIKTEREALQKQDNLFAENAKKAELDSIYQLWLGEKIDLDVMKAKKNTIAIEDRNILYAYIKLRLLSVKYLQRMENEGSFLFLDSVNYVNIEIENLPSIKYGLNFYPEPEKKDSLTSEIQLFDKNWCVTEEEDEKVYFRKLKVDKLGRMQGWVLDYYPDSTIQMKGMYHDNLQHGFTFYYYPNGVVKSAGVLSKERRVGRWQNFYRNGKLKSELQYFENGRSEVINFYDSTGAALLVNGSGFVSVLDDEDGDVTAGRYKNHLKDGVWLTYSSNSEFKYKEMFALGNFLGGESNSPDNKLIHYEQITEAPQPAIGWDAYNAYVDSAIVKTNKPPRKTAACIELFVDSLGKITYMRPKFLIGDGCEDTLIAIIKRKPEFKVGKLRGVPKGMKAFVWGKF